MSESHKAAVQALSPAAKSIECRYDDIEELGIRSASAPTLGKSWKNQYGRASYAAFDAQAGLEDMSKAPSRASLPGTGQPLLIMMQLGPRAAAVQHMHMCTACNPNVSQEPALIGAWLDRHLGIH